MGKGKKKGKKEGDEKEDAPSISGLSISEDAPSTSQATEEEDGGLGLGVGSRKNKRKQKQAEAKASATQSAQPTSSKEATPPQDKPVEQVKLDEPAPKSVEPAPKPAPKSEIKKEEPKEEESEGLGLGLGGGGKKRPKKKKSLASAEAEAKPQAPASATLKPVPEQPVVPQAVQVQAAQEFPGLAPPGAPAAAPWGAGRGFGRGAAPPGRGQVPPGSAGPRTPFQAGPPPGYMTPQPGYMAPQPGYMAPQPGYMAPQPGYMDPQPGYMAQQPGPMATQPGPKAPPPAVSPAMSTSSASSRASTHMSSSKSSTEVVRPSLSKAEICRYKIPVKVVGRSVRHTPTKVITNYLPMTFKPIKVFRYDVIIKPDRPKKMLPAAFKLAIKKNYPNNPYIAFDQAKNCYTLEALKDVPSNGSTRNSILVELKDPNDKPIRFEVSFKATGIVDLANLKRHMDTGGSTLNAPNEEIQCVDVILRQGALEAYVKCGRQFFKRPSRPIDLTGGLEMWTGLFQSAIFTTHAFINIDVAHKGFPIHQSMIDAVTKSFRLSTDRKIEEQRSREIDNFLSFLKGLRVVATLVGPPNNGQTREFIANGLVECPAKLSFECEKNGKKVSMTVAEYFAKEKGYRIRYPHLNCVWVGPRDKNIYYPMELLQVAYGQARNRQLNEFQLSNMVREAAAPPVERKRKIEEVANCMNYSSNTFFKKFGLEISNKFLEVNAKILTPPNLDCGDRSTVMPRKGQWQSNRLVKPEALASWGFIAIDCDPNSCNYETMREMLMNVGRQLGMAVAEPKLKYFNVKITELRNLLFSALEREVGFLFIIVGTRGRDTYHKVKQMAERDVGILTQCVKENTASRRMNMQTIKNILLKVNSKLMGVNQVLDARTMPNCLKGGDVMIVGADVTHPSPEQTSVPSIAAVTASMDAKAFSYAIELSIQTPKKEMIVEFADMMFDHLRRWREKHRALPRKIYVFRDGVSEGQFAEVMNSELTAVHRAYERFGAPHPEVLFLLVQKRHHTRFFTSPKCENVEPGTVVDTHIVHSKELDFYLVSHQAIKGTARPTRYHAVCNDGNIPDDEVEQLTFYLCHLYSRCMRSVSYPTPTYYAHLACFRARSLTYGQTFDNAALESKPQRLHVLEKMLASSRMFFV